MRKELFLIPIIAIIVSVVLAITLTSDQSPATTNQPPITMATDYILPELPPGEYHPIPDRIANANNQFAIDFYKQISDNNDNIFYSPSGIFMAFSVLYEGAKENTAKELQEVFGFEIDDNLRHELSAKTISSLNREDPDSTLTMANALWIADWFKPYEQYVDVAIKAYDAETTTVTFPGEGVEKINAWADEKTNGKITDVITPMDLPGDTTAMVITNAIYFKGTWAEQFEEEDTKESDFWVDVNNNVSTDFMNIGSSFDYTSSDNAQILKLPYEGDRLSMLFILPTEKNKLDSLEETLTSEMIMKWNQDLSSTGIIVSIPKFEMNTNYELNDYLMAMGIVDVFDKSSANLLDIGPPPGTNLYVSKALQKAFVNVNESGTEAAAVSFIGIGTTSEPPPIPKFIADHPFLFLIQDDESGAILFMGRVSDPASFG